MSNIGRWMIMSEFQAAGLRDATIGQENRIEPRRVEVGVHAGKYALPERLRFADEFEGNRDVFSTLTVIVLDADEAWPPTEEEMAARRAEEA